MRILLGLSDKPMVNMMRKAKEQCGDLLKCRAFCPCCVLVHSRGTVMPSQPFVGP